MAPGVSNMEDLDRGWSWLVLVSSFCYFMVFGVFVYGVGVVHEILLDEYGGKSSTTAWAGSLFASLISLAGPVSSVIIDKWSCRTAMLIDGILTTIGCLATALCPNLTLCIFTYGILAGFGGGIGYTATMLVVGFNFQRWRTTALAIALAGVGVGTCVFTPLMEVIRTVYGNSGYFIILAAIGFHKCLFAVICRPSRLELARQQTLASETEDTMTKKQVFQLYAKVYRNALILCFSLSLMLFSMGTYMIFLHLQTYVIGRGYTRIAASMLLSICGLSTILAGLVTSHISERKNIDEIVLYSGSFCPLAFGTFLFPVYSWTYAGLVVYYLLLGAYFGGSYAILNTVNTKLVGTEYLSIATGMELLFSAIGTVVGPVITGTIIDKGGTYEHAFMIAAFVILIGSALGMATVVFQPDDDKPEIPDVDLIIANNGDIINETASTKLTSTQDKHLSNKKDTPRRLEISQHPHTSKCSRDKACNTPTHECHCETSSIKVSSEIEITTSCAQELSCESSSTCVGSSSHAPKKTISSKESSKQPSNRNKPCSSSSSIFPACKDVSSDTTDSHASNSKINTQPINFTEEIQKLLNGEEILFADDNV